MAIKRVPPIEGQQIILVTGTNEPTVGSAGIKSQLCGQVTTVSSVAEATGGIKAGNLIEVDV
ncbi:MAG: hypothetical protein HXO19_08945 [Prevotella shahii]|jgi:hypothetical protein|uniref:hypothetical protein n=1 Tax=Hoylesella shahii TaxID=228603 RepID=UPI001CAB21A3|nr:hypothetical protein [Hoylesella shahii]MBF1591204.1 hypothetical protein [Hoylesella shahii]DAO14531.1 MAG TPA: hypothetical protein [Caudoviricetes sp.]